MSQPEPYTDDMPLLELVDKLQDIDGSLARQKLNENSMTGADGCRIFF